MLFRLLLDIALLRRPPQDLPASTALTALALAAHALTSSALALPALPVAAALAYGPVETGLMLGLVWALLRAAGKAERTRQTLSALAGSGSLLNLVGLPLLAGAPVEPGTGPTFAGFALLALVVWSFAVWVHVLRHALELHPATSVLYNFGLFLVGYAVLGALFPAAGG